MRIIQVTLGAGATKITTGHIYTPFVTIQNNSAATCRVGDNTVSATKGILLASGSPGGSMTIQRADNRIFLDQYQLFGTAGTQIDVLYE